MRIKKQVKGKRLNPDICYWFQGKNKPSTFKNTEGVLFSGFIKGVTKYGKLQVILEDEIVKKFDLKEITLLY